MKIQLTKDERYPVYDVLPEGTFPECLTVDWPEFLGEDDYDDYLYICREFDRWQDILEDLYNKHSKGHEAIIWSTTNSSSPTHTSSTATS